MGVRVCFFLICRIFSSITKFNIYMYVILSHAHIHIHAPNNHTPTQPTAAAAAAARAELAAGVRQWVGQYVDIAKGLLRADLGLIAQGLLCVCLGFV